MTNSSTPDEDFTLPDLGESTDLDALVAAENEADAQEAKTIKQERNKRKLKYAGIAGGGAAGLAAVVVGILVFNPFGGAQGVGVAGPGTAGVDDGKKTSTADVGYTNKAAEWWQEGDTLYPVELEEWQLKAATVQDSTALRESILKSQDGTSLVTMATILPSEETGFTANPEEVELPDGTFNPYYSFWTAEVFRSEVGGYMERLLNPRFGGWETAQYLSKDFTGSSLDDMFTSRWLATEGLNLQNYPVYLDWSDSDYGLSGTLLPTGSRWMGDATDATVDFVFDEATQQYNAHLVANVKFTAWTVDQKSIEKTGVLTLDLVANPNLTRGVAPHHVLIDSAKLEVN